MESLNNMEVGALIDYCIEYNKQTNGAESAKTTERRATDADWKNYFG